MIRDWRPRRLASHERRIVRALVEGLYDPRGAGDVEPAITRVLEEIEAWLSALDRTKRIALRALLLTLELSPIGRGLGARTMSGLALRQRTRWLGELDAKGATALIVWKTLVGAAYFAHPIGEEEMRRRPPPSSRERISTIRRMRRRHLAIAASADDAGGGR